MNVLGHGLIPDPVALACVTEDLRSVVEDPSLRPDSADIITPTDGGITLNTASGVVTRSETTDTVNGRLGPLNYTEKQSAAYEVGDMAFQVPVAGLVAVPNTESRLVVGSQHYEVLSVSTDPLNIFHRLMLRRRKGA